MFIFKLKGLQYNLNCVFLFTRRILRYYSNAKLQKLLSDSVNDMPVNQYLIKPHERNRLYVWGNLQTGALGIPHSKEKENTEVVRYFKSPKRMHFAEISMVHQVATGFGFTLFGMKNNVFGSGLNTESQIGYHEVRRGSPLEILFIPQDIQLSANKAVDEPIKILKIAAGRAHSAILTSQGLFLFGSNAYGQCARKIIEGEKYGGSRMVTHINSIDGKQIKDIVCGQDHTLAILDNGSVYASGWGADGQTGLGHYNNAEAFTPLGGDISMENITKIACRSDFSLAINDKNQVFGWGNIEYSQMVVPDGSQQIATPSHIPILDGKDIMDVATGGSFCLALSSDGEVYVWGFGILGVGPNVQESRLPIRIPKTLFGYNAFNSNEFVVSVHAGLSHMAAITNIGNLYTWGRNRECCLGLGIEQDQYFPFKVAVGGLVKDVSCGLDHTIAICSSYVTNMD